MTAVLPSMEQMETMSSEDLVVLRMRMRASLADIQTRISDLLDRGHSSHSLVKLRIQHELRLEQIKDILKLRGMLRDQEAVIEIVLAGRSLMRVLDDEIPRNHQYFHACIRFEDALRAMPNYKETTNAG